MRQGDKKYSDKSSLKKGDKEVQGNIFSALLGSGPEGADDLCFHT